MERILHPATFTAVGKYSPTQKLQLTIKSVNISLYFMEMISVNLVKQ